MSTPAESSADSLPIPRRFSLFAVGGSLENEADLRLHHDAVLVALGVPMMLFFGVLNLVHGTIAIGVSIIASCLGLTVVLDALLRLGRGPSVYRLNFLYFALITGFGTHYGGPGGSDSLWACTCPLPAFFLFGLREGLAWAVVMPAGVATAMSTPVGFAFAPGYILRFAASYAMVTAVTYGYGHLRTACRRGMENEQHALHGEIAVRRRAAADKEQLIGELRQALEEVGTLRGLIPVCAGCHLIRDDGGFRQRLESSFEQRSDARFSHGLCPDGARRLYPDLVDDLNSEDCAADPPPTVS